jgi:hypothetical protein
MRIWPDAFKDEHKLLRIAGFVMCVTAGVFLVIAAWDNIISKENITGWQIILLVAIGFLLIILPELSNLVFVGKSVEIGSGLTRIKISDIPAHLDKKHKELMDLMLDIICLQSLVFGVSDIILTEIYGDEFDKKLAKRRQDLFRKFAEKIEDNYGESKQISIKTRLTGLFIQNMDVTVTGIKKALSKLSLYNGQVTSKDMDSEFFEAVARFQLQKKIIPADGIFGPSTLDKLLEAVDAEEVR